MSGRTGQLRDLNSIGLSRTLDAHEQEMRRSRAGILREAATGDAIARVVAKRILNLSGWWSREYGNIVGELSQVVADSNGAASSRTPGSRRHCGER